MKPIDFPGANHTFAKNQPQYTQLPAFVSVDGTVTSCWSLSLKERVRMLLTGRLWLSMLTFGSPVQPVRLSTERP